jgi:hypothetical protein
MPAAGRQAGSGSCLDAGKPAIAFTTDAHISQFTLYRPAQAQPDPAQLGQLQALVDRVELELLGIWEPEARIEAVLLEAGKASSFYEKALVGLVLAFEGLLLGLGWAFGQPLRCWCMAPHCQPLAHLNVTDILLAARVPRTLLSKGFVPQPAQLARPAGQLTPLFRLQAKLKAKGFELMRWSD